MKNVEYEATFFPVEKDVMREKLRAAGAVCEKEEFMQKRICFDVTDNCQWDGAWIRVRDEDDKMTMTLKAIAQKNGDSTIEDQREVELIIDNFENGVLFLEKLGFRKKSYQETRREKWMLDGVEVVIDEWPWLPPYIEVEGTNEQEVRDVAEKLGFDWSEAIFDAVSELYCRHYGISYDTINNTERITFEDVNPFGN